MNLPPGVATASVASCFRRDHATLPAYEPPVWAEELAERVGIPLDRCIRLDLNENPYGPSPRAVEAMRRVHPERYPDSELRRLRAALAHHCGVPPETIVPANGGDEIADLILRLFLEPGDEIIDLPPTFSMYRILAPLNR